MARKTALKSETVSNLVTGLRGPGYFVLDDFLGSEQSHGLQTCLKASHQRGDFKPGRVGPAAAITQEASLRSDKSMCVGPGWNDQVDDLIDQIRHLIDSAARSLPELRGNVTGPLTPAAVQCAVYPGAGSFYMRHVDNPGSDPEDRRKLTTIYYCNKSWVPSDGGSLRLHWADGAVCAGRKQQAAAAQALGVPELAYNRRLGITHDVDPIGDRLVVFWADYRMPHEVLPSHGMRFAVSTWWAEPEVPGVPNLLYAQSSVPQRFALKSNEFRPELLKSAKAAVKNFAAGKAAQVRALLSHGICRLSQYFGPEAVLNPKSLREGVAALASSVKEEARVRLNLGHHNVTPSATTALVQEFLELLDKFMYTVGSLPEKLPGKCFQDPRIFKSGGRTLAFLTSPRRSGRDCYVADCLPMAQLHAIFFLWGVPGWVASHNGSEQLEVAPGDLWLLPIRSSPSQIDDALGNEEGTPPHLVLERRHAPSSQPSVPSGPPRWIEVWFFGDALLQKPNGAMTNESDGTTGPNGSFIETAAELAKVINKLEDSYVSGTGISCPTGGYTAAPSSVSEVRTCTDESASAKSNSVHLPTAGGDFALHESSTGSAAGLPVVSEELLTTNRDGNASSDCVQSGAFEKDSAGVHCPCTVATSLDSMD